jgi:hypothetical protein
VKRTPLKRNPDRMAAADRDASMAWAARARSKRCVMCGAAYPHGHHVIYLQELKRTVRSKRLEHRRQGILYDRRNMLPLCERHHSAHHSGMHPLPLDVVLAACPKAEQFASELGLGWFLERYYLT